MYKKILVALDGSSLAECSLEHAKTIAKGCGVSEVILFQAVESVPAEAVAGLAKSGGDLLKRAELDNQQEAANYLDKIGESLKKEGLTTRTVVVDGNPADEILNYADQNEIDLIVLSSHGRSGTSRWLFGSVAEKVSRHSTIPVLLVSAPGCRPAPSDRS